MPEPRRNASALDLHRFERQAKAKSSELYTAQQQYGYAAGVGSGRNNNVLNSVNSSHSGGAGPPRGSKPTSTTAAGGNPSSVAGAGAGASAGAIERRPQVKSRAKSSPLLELKRPGRPADGDAARGDANTAGAGDEATTQARAHAQAHQLLRAETGLWSDYNSTTTTTTTITTTADSSDATEVAGVVDAARHFSRFHTPEVCMSIPQCSAARSLG